MKNNLTATTLVFHKNMNKIVDKTGGYYSPYGNENILTIEELFLCYTPYMSEDFPASYQEEFYKEYFKEIAGINYSLAKKASGTEDKVVILDGKTFTVPFFMFDISQDEFDTIELNGNKLSFKTEASDDIEEDGSILKEVSISFEYICDFNSEGVITSYVETKNSINKENLKEFIVEYEHFSSHAYDTGGSKTVFATSADMAQGIVSHVVYPPEDGLSWDFSVYDNKYNVLSEDDSPCSYLNAIERPGIARAEAELLSA